MKLMRFDEAKKYAEKILEMDPANTKARLKLASVHFFLKEYHKAIDEYKKVLSTDPENAEAKKGLMET